MRWRRLRWAVAVVALLGFGAAALLLWPQPESVRRFTRELYDRIRPGMSLAEVEGVLGCPPGFYETSLIENDPERTESNELHNDQNWVKLAGWQDDGAVITLGFNQAQEVTGKRYAPLRPVSLGHWDKLRWRLHRRWPNWFSSP
jgi:hypothetical protein